jgi:filamentous hemagglutinin family protein
MKPDYRSKWQNPAGAIVAASASADSDGNSSPPYSSAAARKPRLPLTALAVALTLAFGTNVHALPSGGAVSAGSANITGGPGKVTINQSTQNVAINWQSFNIAAAEAVQFVQPNSSAVALNRVLGADPSSIFGSLSANGKVFLVNPNGILFGQGAQVNVAGLVASTLKITDTDFMAGNYRFSGAGNGAVLNQGTISADGGYVALLGANVSNQGVIVAKLGSVALAAGNAITLDFAGDGLLNVVVNQGTANALAGNGGLIRADGGQVLLTAQAAGNLLQGVVNNTGLIQAQTVENHNGTIRLSGDIVSGTVNVGGTLDASGAGAGQSGGSVTITGHHVGLFGGHINASGDAGGGTVLIGGGYQGKNITVQNASATYMSSDSTIAADAITSGNGGTVVLWASDSTRAYGSITARAGSQGGDGGLIETSGHWLDLWGIRVNASAPHGKSGLWLLDPADVTIGAATTNATLTANVFSPNSGVSLATVGVADLRTALEAGTGTDVTITTTNTGAPGNGAGNITVASALTWTPGVSATLTLNAAGDVNINADISISRGNLVVCCGQDVNLRAAITTAGGGGSVLLSAGRDVRIERTLANLGTAITVTNGNITLCAGGDVVLSNTFNPPTALMSMTDSGTGALSLGLSPGLVLSAGNGGTGPGVAGGTVTFTPGTLIALTRAGAPVLDVTINYNAPSYAVADRTNYLPLFTLAGGINVNQRVLVFPEAASKVFDGTTTATFTGLKGSPAGVLLAGAGTANFVTPDVGVNKIIIFSGFTLAGANANDFALPGSAVCCTPAVERTTGAITPVALVVGPGIVPPVIVVAPADAVPAAVPSSALIEHSIGSVLPLQLTGLSLGVLGGGIRMPPTQLAEVASPVRTDAIANEAPNQVEAIPVRPAPVVVPPEKPAIYAPPLRPRRPDRH